MNHEQYEIIDEFNGDEEDMCQEIINLRKEIGRSTDITKEELQIRSDVEVWLLRLHNEPDQWSVNEALSSIMETVKKIIN